MKKIFYFFQKKITNQTFQTLLKLSTQISKWGLILSLLTGGFYIAFHLSWNELKTVFLYYYSKFLILDGDGQKVLHIVNSVGDKNIISAANLINDPVALLLKHDFYWTILKGIFISYIFFKVFWILTILWLYIKRKINN